MAGARGLLLPALLAVPHLASAVGTSFLLAPSGWIVRAFSPWLTGWQRPPDLATVNDPWGLALTFGLALREAPFLLLALAAARPQVATARILAVGRTSGYGPIEAWLKLVLPLLYRQIRLPLYAVLAFALSVVDMAIVLGPSAPPALAVQALRWLTDPDPAWHPVGAAAAILQLVLIVVGPGAVAHGRMAGRPYSPILARRRPEPIDRALPLAARPGSGCDRVRHRARGTGRDSTLVGSRRLALSRRLAAGVLAGELAVGRLRPCDGDVDHARGRSPCLLGGGRRRPRLPRTRGSRRRAPRGPVSWRWSTCPCCCRRSPSSKAVR